MQNPFKQAEAVATPLKILMYGPSGSGKTRAALTFPRVALIDAEGGSKLYRGRVGIPPFHALDCKTLKELEEAVAFIDSDKGKSFDTLVIDPITVFYQVQRAAVSKNHEKDLSMRDWAKVNSRMQAVYTKLTNLPVHVVVIAREANEFAGQGEELKVIGKKPEADKSLVYNFDFTLHLEPNHSAVIEKSRGVTLGKNGRVDKVDWSLFEPVAAAFATGQQVEQQSDEAVAEVEADAMWDDDAIKEFVTYWNGQSITNDLLLQALEVKGLREWKRGRAAADKIVRGYVDLQIATSKEPASAGK